MQIFFDDLFLNQTDIEYFKTLYALLAQSKEREQYSYQYNPFYTTAPTRNEILRNVEFFMCEDKKLHSVKDNLFLRTNYKPIHYLKNPLYLDISLKNTSQDKTIKHFLLSLGVKEMCEQEDLIADVSGDNIPVDDMILKMMEIIHGYKNKTISIKGFIDSPIFIAVNGDETLYRVSAKECCWNSVSSFFYQETKYTLAQERYQVLGDDLPILQDIFSKLGGKIVPKIVESNDLSAYSFPLHHLLKTARERYDTCLKSTYTIDEFDWNKLKRIQEEGLTLEAKLLWDIVINCNEKDYLFTEYRPNWSAATQKLESTLVYYLKRIAWIPTTTGKYKRPYELTEEDLLDDYKYEHPSLLLTEISKKPNDAVEQLKNKGIQDENMLAFAGLDTDVQERVLAIAGQIQEQKRKTGKSLSELAATSDREQSPEEDDDDDYGVFHKPKNMDKRKLKLEKEFDDREDLPTFIKKLRFVLEKPNNEEKTFVRNEYHSHCQLCGNEGILTAKGKCYFEAINIFNTGKLDDSLQIKFDLGWNTLCLCPNCAAKFKYSQLTISGLIEQVESIDISNIQNEFIDIPITLECKSAIIHFTPKHLLALQVAIKKIKEIETNE